MLYLLRLLGELLFVYPAFLRRRELRNASKAGHGQVEIQLKIQLTC